MINLMQPSLSQQSYYLLPEKQPLEEKDINFVSNKDNGDKRAQRLKNLNDETKSFLKELHDKNWNIQRTDIPHDALLEQGKRLKFRVIEALQNVQQTNPQTGETLVSKEVKTALVALSCLTEAEKQWDATEAPYIDVNGSKTMPAVAQTILPTVTATGSTLFIERVPIPIINSLAQLQNIKQDSAVDLPILLMTTFANVAHHLSNSIHELPVQSREKDIASLLLHTLNEGLTASDIVVASVQLQVQEMLNTAELNDATRLMTDPQIHDAPASNDKIIVVTSSIMTLIMMLLTLLNKDREASNKVWSASLDFLTKQFTAIRDTIIANGKSSANQQLSAAIAGAAGAVFMAGVSVYNSGKKIHQDKLSQKAQDRVAEHQSVERLIDNINNKIKLPKTPKTPSTENGVRKDAEVPTKTVPTPTQVSEPSSQTEPTRFGGRTGGTSYSEHPLPLHNDQSVDIKKLDNNSEIEVWTKKYDDVLNGLNSRASTSHLERDLNINKRKSLMQEDPSRSSVKSAAQQTESENTILHTYRSEVQIKTSNIERRLSEITLKAKSADKNIDGLIEELMIKEKNGHFKLQNNIVKLIDDRQKLKVFVDEMHELGRPTTLRERLTDGGEIDVDKLDGHLNEFHIHKIEFVNIYQENTTQLKNALLEWNAPELNKLEMKQRLHAQSAQKSEVAMQTTNALTMPFSQLTHASTFSACQDSVSEAKVQEEMAKHNKEIISKTEQISDKQSESITTNEKTWTELLQNLNQIEISVFQKMSNNLKG
jgi:hypothetical protein